jgi:hypothetical protein
MAPSAAKAGTTVGDHGSERDRFAGDPVVERDLGKLLEDHDCPVVERAIRSVVDLLASPVERAELAAVGEEVRVLAW